MTGAQEALRSQRRQPIAGQPEEGEGPEWVPWVEHMTQAKEPWKHRASRKCFQSSSYSRLPMVLAALATSRGRNRLAALLVLPVSVRGGFGTAAIYRLYATIVPLVVYAVVGPSRILVHGPAALPLAPLSRAAILPLGPAGSEAEAVALAGPARHLLGPALRDRRARPVRVHRRAAVQAVRYGYMNGSR